LGEVRKGDKTGKKKTRNEVAGPGGELKLKKNGERKGGVGVRQRKNERRRNKRGEGTKHKGPHMNGVFNR